MKQYITVGVVALALSIGGCSRSEAHASPAATTTTPLSGPAVRQTITVDGAGFHPTRVSAKAGQTVTLVFRRVTDATCGTEVVFKDLGIKKALPLNQDVEIKLQAKGSPIGFACGMDMMKGSIVAQ
jgi:plastocyanin domain-containing protein